jgi:tRNA(His) guanylyltransferase
VQKFESVDARCKFFEQNFTGKYLMPTTPALCRVDGKAFHTFTKGLKRPFDERLSGLMVDTAKFLVEKTHCKWAFVESDEISLCWFSSDTDSQIFFDGKTQKIVSVTASLATYYFNWELTLRIPEKATTMALFDARCWSVPSIEESLIYANWRQQDTVKNAASMAAHANYSHKELQGVNTRSKIGMLKKKGIEFDEYPSAFRNGTFIRRILKNISFSAQEIKNLPANHQARKNPSLQFQRHVIECTSEVKLSQAENAVGFLFEGEEPIAKDQKRDDPTTSILSRPDTNS